jgi:hypothetical protein
MITAVTVGVLVVATAGFNLAVGSTEDALKSAGSAIVSFWNSHKPGN